MGVSKEKKKITLVSPFNKTIDPNTVQAKAFYNKAKALTSLAYIRFRVVSPATTATACVSLTPKL